MLTTSLELLKMAGAYGPTTPISIEQVLEHNGLDNALWALRAVPREQEAERDRKARLLACKYAEHVQTIFEARFPNARLPRECIEVSRRYALGQATKEELRAAFSAAAVALDAADAAFHAFLIAAFYAAAAAIAAAYARVIGSEAVERTWQEARLREMLQGGDQ